MSCVKGIEVKALNDSAVGAWVIYETEYKRECGRIKSWNDKYIFVVFNCDKQWDNFKDYTGCATDPEDLTFFDEGE